MPKTIIKNLSSLAINDNLPPMMRLDLHGLTCGNKVLPCLCHHRYHERNKIINT